MMSMAGRYWPGRHTEEQRNKVVIYVVETIKDNKFVYVGIVEVRMDEVYDAMDRTRNIKDNMPSKFARNHARKKYPDANPVIVMPIDEWCEKYGGL